MSQLPDAMLPDTQSAVERAVDELLRRAIEYARSLQKLPESTYRLQLHKDFTFDDAVAIVPYLAALGISHCYASPYLRATAGSTHGYDVIDHRTINPELGGEQGLHRWIDAMRRHGMSHILDIVPNHVGVASNDNAWWNDVLEHGMSSRYASHFDISWQGSPRAELHGRVLLPLLGGPYGQVLDKGELKLSFDIASGSFAVNYYQRRFPISPSTYGRILGRELPELDRKLGADRDAWHEYTAICAGLDALPSAPFSEGSGAADRHRDSERLKQRLAALAGRSPVVREFIEAIVRDFNGTPGEPCSFEPLDDLLTHQHYRLAFWRNASDEINYRRFFDVNELAALAMERQEVFEASHELILRLAAAGKVAGLRIDHPDGLYDPREYLLRLQQHFVLACAEQIAESDQSFEHSRESLRERLLARLSDPAAIRSDSVPGGWPLYVVAEKILAIGEPLPQTWAVHGTSGYDLLNMVNGLFVDPAAREPLTQLYEQWTGDDTTFEELIYRRKRLILEISLAGELQMLAHQLDRLAQRDPHSRDFTLNRLRSALRELIACFPVYRPYISDQGASEIDARHIDAAVEHAIRRTPGAEPSVFEFIRDTLLLRFGPDVLRDDQRRFAGKFQQVTAPATAKGVEDTAFYVYQRLVSLNEVGGEPSHFGVPPAQLHDYLRQRQATWPHALSVLSTHDTKRSEDVRARIDVLSEIPQEWERHVTRWREMNALHAASAGGSVAPAADEEYLLYQTLVGAYPMDRPDAAQGGVFVKRIQAYMLKAIREAKLRTSWSSPNESHEQAVQQFVERILDESVAGEFLADFRAFQSRVSEWGMINSLAQTLLRLTVPGVPDTYQGTELWDLSLVDPDNRRPVDYDHRRRMLESLQQRISDSGTELAKLARELVEQRTSGAVKLYVTWRGLTARRERPGLFTGGEYDPLEFTGSAREHAFGFVRRHLDHAAFVVVPRLVAKLSGGDPGRLFDAELWGGTSMRLPQAPSGARPFRNVFTGATLSSGGEIPLSELFRDFPVALFVTED